MITSPQAYEEMREHIHGMWKSYAIQAAVYYDFATIISDGEKTTAELAQATNTQEQWIYRLLQFLAAYGIFAEGPAGVFTNTERSMYLRADRGTSLSTYVRMMGTERYRLTWGKLEECLRTGVPAVRALYGKKLYEYFEDHPQEEELFDRALENVAEWRNRGILQAYDFSTIHTLIDIGGGTGHLLTMIHMHYPDLQGILFERVSIIERLRAQGFEASHEHALKLVAGDFFASIPAGADAYLLQEVLHNWDDAQCVQILRNCRQAMPAHAVLLICEGISQPVVACEDKQLARVKGLSLLMALEQEGDQRTREDFTRILNEAGFSVRSIRPGAPMQGIIEAVIA